MKRLLLILLTFICTITVLADNKQLIITFIDGTSQAFALSNLPDIKMENDKMTIKAGETTAEYDLYKVKTFTIGEATGIEGIALKGFTMDGNKFIVPGVNNSIRLYSVDGKKVELNQMQTDSASFISLDALPKGVYIISANGKSVKILKK